MAAWTTFLTEMRQVLRDGPTDRLRWRKKVFGEVDGTNVRFKTFEFRRVTNLSTAADPLGVYLDGVRTTALTDDLTTGVFTLGAAPAEGVSVEASYYCQTFTDTELTQFVTNAAEWLGFDAPSQVVLGLQASAREFAAGEAFHALSRMYADKLSETFLLEDAPDADRVTAAQTYKTLSDAHYTQAKSLRDDYYTRQGQSLQPLFGVVAGNVKRIP